MDIFFPNPFLPPEATKKVLLFLPPEAKNFLAPFLTTFYRKLFLSAFTVNCFYPRIQVGAAKKGVKKGVKKGAKKKSPPAVKRI